MNRVPLRRTFVLCVLLAAGADPGIKNKDKKLPRTLAAEAGHPKVAGLLSEDTGR